MIIVSSFNAKTLPNVHELLPSMEPLVLIVPRDTKLDDLSTFISRLQYNYPGILVIAPLHIACHHGSFCSEECDSSTTLSTQFPFINIVYFLKGRVRTSFAKEFTKTLIKQLGEWTDANPRSVDYAFRSTLQMMKSLDQLPSTRVPNNYDLRTTKAYPSLDILEDLYFQLLQSFGHSGPNDDELFNIWRDNCRFKMMVKPKDMEFHIWILCWMFGKESYDTFRHRMGFQELDPKTIPKNFIMAHVLACWINWLHHPILRLRTIFDITQHKNQYMVQLQILSNVPNQRGVSPSIGPAIQLAYQIAMHISGDEVPPSMTMTRQEIEHTSIDVPCKQIGFCVPSHHVYDIPLIPYYNAFSDLFYIEGIPIEALPFLDNLVSFVPKYGLVFGTCSAMMQSKRLNPTHVGSRIIASSPAACGIPILLSPIIYGSMQK